MCWFWWCLISQPLYPEEKSVSQEVVDVRRGIPTNEGYPGHQDNDTMPNLEN
jgi:hypothetical protein